MALAHQPSSGRLYIPEHMSIGNNESLQALLCTELKQGTLSAKQMDDLQTRCCRELSELRQELDTLLEELRDWLRVRRTGCP
ncbi:hypothetical protein [Paenibacillus cymbidii]|uniref:hypothetical protein n=1 Tax=Paenibacillus cymbidii TaxID=1639034 RepID=UPI0010806AFF|nr:hypothetical protein [Paenibacillus cymbidii]